ncbi:MAG TPA: hypothetical protein VFO89_17540 [Thermoanaerobaculia bacterium]|nr:hypothetical protein [Thermoanaerobaculia bacterium]
MTRPRLALTALLALAPLSAQATIARAVTFEEKVENAAAIVVGKCISQQSRWDEARSWILTYSTFRVEKTLKGFPAQEITIVTPGGTVGTIAQDVIGVPKFRPGDEHVLFVRNSQAGPTVLYLEQGDYRVIENRGEKLVQPAVTSGVLLDTGRGAAAAPEPVRTLRDLEDRVRRTVRDREALRMKMLVEQKRAETSIWSLLKRNFALVALALVGLALAAWQISRRW